MQENKQDNKVLQVGTQLCGIAFGLVGVLIAFCLIFLGFWKTLLIAAFFAVGYLLGSCSNKRRYLQATIDVITDKKND